MAEVIEPRKQRVADDGLGGVARGSALNLAGAAVASLASVTVVAVVTRGFPRHDAGIFFSATSLFLFLLTVTKLGTDTGLVYFIARFRSLGAVQRIGSCLRSALTPVAGASTLAAVVLFVFAEPVSTVLVPADPATLAPMLRALAVFLPFAALSDSLAAATRGYRKMTPTVLVDRIGRQVGQLGLVALVAFAAQKWMLPLAWAGPYLPAALIGWLWLSTLRRGGERAASADEPVGAGAGSADEPASDHDPRFWRFTLPRALASVAQTAIQRLDIIMVAALLGPAPAAIYTAATRFLSVGRLGSQAISLALQPRLSELLARGDRVTTNTIYQTATMWLVAITWPFYLLVANFAPWILGLFGTGYETGSNVTILLAITMLGATACGMVSIVLIMAGKSSWNLANTALALGVNIGLNFLLIPWFGIFGAALAWTATILVSNLVPLCQVAYSLRLHPFSAGLASVVALAATCFGVVPVVLRAAFGDGVGILAAAVSVGAVGYLCGCWKARNRLRLDVIVRRRPA